MNKRQKELLGQLEIIYKNKWQTKPYTVVTVLAKLNGSAYAGIGATVWTEKDIWSDEQGFEIAEGRAMSNIVHRIEIGEIATKSNADECFSKGAQCIPLPG